MTALPRPCLDCGTLVAGQTRCVECRRRVERERSARRGPRPHYAGDYNRRAKAVRESGAPCYLCGTQGSPDNPMQADHLVEGDPASPLLPCCRRCNIRKSHEARRARG